MQCATCQKALTNGSDTITLTTRNAKGDVTNERVICRFCDMDERADKFIATEEITTSLMMDASLKTYRGGTLPQNPEYPDMDLAIAKRVQTAVDEIKVTVTKAAEALLPKVKAAFKKSKTWGVSAIAEDFKVLAGETAGRGLMTIQDTKPQGAGVFGGAMITLIFDPDADDEHRAGIQGICATKAEALGLLTAALERCPKFTDDKGVGFGF